MIISTILAREKIKIDSTIKILWTPCSNEFEEFIKQIGYELISFNQIYYGNSIPNIIFCNNKIDYYDICYNLSNRLHLPVLLIDHTAKNPLYDTEKVKGLNNFVCMHHICISKNISDSWQLKNAQILSYNLNDKDNIKIWKNLIFQTTKKIFK